MTNVRQHEIENEQFVLFCHGKVVPVKPIAGKVDHKSGFAQPLPKVVAILHFVLDDQDIHARILDSLILVI